MERYTYAELKDMHFIYGAAAGNAREAARRYREQFPNRRHLAWSTFQMIRQRLGEIGSLQCIM